MKPPRFTLEEIEDYYTLYVLIYGIPENVFWNYDVSFVLNVADNKAAYEGWLSGEREAERKRHHNKR